MNKKEIEAIQKEKQDSLRREIVLSEQFFNILDYESPEKVLSEIYKRPYSEAQINLVPLVLFMIKKIHNLEDDVIRLRNDIRDIEKRIDNL